MRKDELTLANIKKSPKLAQPEKAVRLSDLLSKEEIADSKARKAKRKASEPMFDAVDSYVAEIIARFGYEVYEKWNREEISTVTINKWLEAERAREKRAVYSLEALIVSAVSGANNPAKGNKTPKTLKLAYKILKEEQKLAEGRR